MMNKRGQEQLHMYIFYTIIVIIILAAMIYFVSDVSSGKAVRKQIISKKIALLLDSAQPGTNITINSEDISIEKKESAISVKITGDELSYEYEIYNPHNIEIEEKEGKTIIRIL